MSLKNICIICAAVVTAWAVMLVLLYTGFAIDKTLIAMLMGMSVGAIATKYAPNLSIKVLTVVLGIPLIWFALNGKPFYSAGISVIILLGFLFTSKLNNKKGEQQVDRFKDCC